MNSKELTEHFKNSIVDSKVVCTETELNEFLMYGLLFKNKNSYLTRTGEKLSVNVIKPKTYNFNINLSDLIYHCEQLAKQNKINKIYCMSDSLYKHYLQKGLIINQNGNEFFRIYDKELWLVNKI